MAGSNPKSTVLRVVGMGRKSSVSRLLSVAVLCGVSQLCLTLCDPMNCSPPGSSAHGILQARILEWVAIPSSRGSSQPREELSKKTPQTVWCWDHSAAACGQLELSL